MIDLKEYDMKLEPWHLAALEEYGYMDTDDGLINRVARYLTDDHNGSIDAEEFRSACFACDVDPDSFSQEDLDKLQMKLNELV